MVAPLPRVIVVRVPHAASPCVACASSAVAHRFAPVVSALRRASCQTGGRKKRQQTRRTPPLCTFNRGRETDTTGEGHNRREASCTSHAFHLSPPPTVLPVSDLRVRVCLSLCAAVSGVRVGRFWATRRASEGHLTSADAPTGHTTPHPPQPPPPHTITTHTHTRTHIPTAMSTNGSSAQSVNSAGKQRRSSVLSPEAQNCQSQPQRGLRARARHAPTHIARHREGQNRLRAAARRSYDDDALCRPTRVRLCE